MDKNGTFEEATFEIRGRTKNMLYLSSGIWYMRYMRYIMGGPLDVPKGRVVAHTDAHQYTRGHSQQGSCCQSKREKALTAMNMTTDD